MSDRAPECSELSGRRTLRFSRLPVTEQAISAVPNGRQRGQPWRRKAAHGGSTNVPCHETGRSGAPASELPKMTPRSFRAVER